jgi:opacity protein-like surface antigen
MKKIAFLLVMLFVYQLSVFSQETAKSQAKTDQAEVYNEFFISYGLGSIFYFTHQDIDYSTTTTGTIVVGFTRTMNRVIGVGFQMSYSNVTKNNDPASMYSYPYTSDDNYWQGIAHVRFRYLNKPSFCMYSGIGMGVTMDYYSETSNGSTKSGQKLLPAGQMTLLGFRAGRALAFFGEFGIGTCQIINAGISYKFGE